MYFKKLIGSKCYLSPISIDDAARYAEWLNDFEVIRNLLGVNWVLSVESERAALERIAKEHNYAIVDSASDELIGNCGFMDLDTLNCKAEVGIFIGNKEYWSKGYGSEALSLLAQYGFQYLNLESILLRVFSFNERAMACYKKVGFKEAGRWRKSVKRERKTFDTIFMDLTYEDFADRQQGS